MPCQRAHSRPGPFEWLDLLDPICGFLITPMGHWFSTWGYWFDLQTVGHLGGVMQPCELWTHQEPTKTAAKGRGISLRPLRRWQCLPKGKAGVVLALEETSVASTRGCQEESVLLGCYGDYFIGKQQHIPLHHELSSKNGVGSEGPCLFCLELLPASQTCS